MIKVSKVLQLLLSYGGGVNDSLSGRFITLKHDVESAPAKALDLARIEHKYGHCATYYVQAYLMTESNQPIFSEIQKMGHEVTYHHDVMDGGKGDLQRAIEIYQSNLMNFRKLGFEVKTVCQHGNPASDFENRDFFRSDTVQSLFPEQADIMVDFMKKIDRVYTYISDVGMSFKIVKDPVNSDKIKESEKYIVLGDLGNVVNEVMNHPKDSYIISSHPHRYNNSALKATFRHVFFSTTRKVAKLMFKIPGVKKFMFKFISVSKHF